MKKIVILFMQMLAVWVSAQAQTSVNMGSQSSITGCDINIYDDGGANGAYGPSLNHTLTVFPTANQGRAVVEILSLDIHLNDTLYIYDGPTATGEPLAALNNDTYNTSLYNNTIMATQNNPSGALTLRFKTSQFMPSFNSHGAGFQLHAFCTAACLPFQIVLDSARCSHIPYLNAADQFYYLDLCPDEEAQLAVKGIYANDANAGYVQRDATTHFTWQLGLQSRTGVGLDSVHHIFTPGAGQEVYIIATDTLSCPAQQPITFRVRTSNNPIGTIQNIPQLCIGQDFTPTVSHNDNSNVVLQEVGYTLTSSLAVHDTVFLPDGENCPPYGLYYRSNVTFTNFTPGATLTNANDILYVRIKMEHSAIEDLRIEIFCPNGSSSTILPHPNLAVNWFDDDFLFRVNLGSACRPDGGSCDPSINTMGDPWNYVWSNNTTLGYQYAADNGGFFSPLNIHSHYNPHWDESNATVFGDNMHSYSVDSTNVAAMTQVYHPFESFNSLVGCPLNGNWYIQVEDLYQEDNGYLVEWELALNPQLAPSEWNYNVSVDSIYFTGNQVINNTTIRPQDIGDQAYTLSIEDDFGCHYDTTIHITVHALPEVALGDDASICEGDSVTLGSESVYNNYVYHWNTGATTPQIVVNTPGSYTLTTSLLSGGAELCHSSDTVVVSALASQTTTLQDEICSGTDYSGHGFEISAATIAQQTAYTGTRTLTAANGCDSVVTLNLTILPNFETQMDRIACEHYLWNGEDYTESGDYIQRFTAANGCDSTVTLHLSIGHPETTEITKSVCGKYVWNNETFTESGDYERLFVSSHECDSLVILHLTVIDTFIRPMESNPDFCTTHETTLSIDGNFDDYVWSTGEVGTFINVTQSGRYSVTASNYACEHICVFEIPHCPLNLLLPNAITPSQSDGLNDYVQLPEYVSNQIQDFSIAIYNRWGELVYASNDKNFRWDGRKDGKLMVNAIYNYLIICTDLSNKPYRFTGSFTVL